MDHDVCQIVLINSDNVDQAARQMPEEAILTRMAGTFRVLGDPTRLRILHGLAVTELCVCDLATLLETTSSAISQQLRLLRSHGLVTFRRDGKVVYYSLNGSNARQLLAAVAAFNQPQFNGRASLRCTSSALTSSAIVGRSCSRRRHGS